jgi:hypothetical protein
MSKDVNVDAHISQATAAVNDAATPCPPLVIMEFWETFVGDTYK